MCEIVARLVRWWSAAAAQQQQQQQRRLVLETGTLTMLFEQVRSIWLPRTPVYYAVNGASAILGLACSLRSGIGVGALLAWLACVATFVGLRRAEESYLHLSSSLPPDWRSGARRG